MKMENSLKFVRLVTGEDVISEVTEIEESDGDRYYILNNPMKVLYMSSETGTMSVSLMQWVFWRISSDQNFNIQTNNVLLMSDISESMEEYYWSSLDHYESMKEKLDKKSFTEDRSSDYDEDSFDDLVDSNESIQKIIDLLTKNQTKRKLH
jgi:hypothetical protein